MKQKDWILIIVVAFISGVLSIFVSKFLISPSTSKLTAVKVPAITTEFPDPDKRYFNANSLNVTQMIKIGENTGPVVISGSSQ